MKKSQISIKWKTFCIFLIFAIVLLGVLWFFQIVYLNDFYKMIKQKETENVLDKVEVLLHESDDPASEIDQLAASYNLGVFITDSDGNSLYNAEYISNSQMSSLPHFMFSLFYDEAVANGGEAVIEFKGSEMQRSIRENLNKELEQQPEIDGESEATPESELEQPENILENAPDSADETSEESSGQGEGKIEYTIPPENEMTKEQFRQNIGNEMAESVIYVRIIEVDGQEEVVMINSVLTPVDATVTTLKAQLRIITVIIIIIAFILAAATAKSTSRSIIKLNDGAKKLAAGDYSVKFDADDYMEVAELSATLNYAAKELGKADSLQKELIANVSHDLRTPLTMIKGYAEVMRDIPGENTPENVQVIIEETERLTGLVNDMLDISKLKAGTISIQPEEYNFTESIRHVLERYNKLREVEGYTIDFVYDDEVNVYADEQKMYQVLYNLVNNAINYTGEDKKVTVIQKVIGNTLRIEVVDTGDGVKQEDIPYVWDRYYKDKTTHKRALQGTGLGLSIVKNVLELHGAKYGVSSITGQGATFWFEIKIDPFAEEE
ncbi:MAG: HAMP domain-containing histidine kinase [Pseudobutyrivibrio ruminis]|uniref:sensor histidine kinase n=1 Tax=Pseudobutyrivibrio ruminis TaxID=46206 RepID=UPI0026E9CC09|nr:HAMP domain-containing sensor histidine kinase [Pseudobutyrivibrio ruminis]MBE5913482.1 HAMP domain-containing histidine kinase [Pseudobutyrivibrio ruminis]